jgi:hypothetical protein
MSEIEGKATRVGVRMEQLGCFDIDGKPRGRMELLGKTT